MATEAEIEAAAKAIMQSPAFADLMSPPSQCARHMAKAALEAAARVRANANQTGDERGT